MARSKRLTLKGLYFIWYIAPSRMCHGKILGRLMDVIEADVFLVEMIPIKGGVPHQSALDIDILTDGRSVELYPDEATCRAAFRAATEPAATEDQDVNSDPRLN